MAEIKVVDYFNYTLPFYKHFWHKDSESHALHYGFWEKDTRSLNEALQNTNKFLAEKVKIKPGEVILDAGCGIGGSAVWLAKHFKIRVFGITITKKQAQKAKDLARVNDVDTLTEFYVKDYLASGFQDESFDIVWAIESICYCQNKKDFLKEAFRLLKRGGRIVIADGFLKRDIRDDKEKQMMQKFAEGMAFPNLARIDEFKRYLEKSGFQNILFWDKTDEVLPSSKRLYNMCRLGYPVARITEKLGITSNILTKNNLAGIVQYKTVKIGLAGYGVFCAEK